MSESRHDPRPVGMSEIQVVVVAAERRNSPLVLVAVLGIVLVGVLWIAALGRVLSGESVVTGTALAVGETAEEYPRPGSVSLSDIAANPLLAPGAPLAAVDCALPELGTDPGELDAYYRIGIGCLDRAWEPVLTGAGLRFASPRLNIDDQPRAKCGFTPSEDEATAFYCDRDRTIYLPRGRLLRDAGEDSAYHLAVLAHEYGHHVQALSGILRASANREAGADENEFLELSRRAELQANCFAGLFFAAVGGQGGVDAGLAEESVRSFEDTSGADSHGTPANQARWARAGFDGNSTASCDTWSVPASEVG
ncbi:neutral zinc metallopeptidase [Actinokineospora iranica]|uniref:Neutral zinc metallopeptidase n=1 Tax=Actinokineospora iranica TaxID=1271860 RepID=A0A1G6LTW3_9PSEU|nr:neutral zinc metallopeptidase [Actinokineospora iranica]SDC46649.1 hypothetical protein SAMN05216174_102238 [Actinokineospora iranica]